MTTMMIFKHNNERILLESILNYANTFRMFCFYDGSPDQYAGDQFDGIIAAGNAVTSCTQSGETLYGYLAYDGEPVFFEAEWVLQLRGNEIEIIRGDTVELLRHFRNEHSGSVVEQMAALSCSESITQYRNKIGDIKRHLQRGDCYEMNYCLHFSGAGIIDPVKRYLKLRRENPAPFSALLKYDDAYCLCASPERFLQRRGSRLKSQPIKGTIARKPNDPAADRQAARELLRSEKNRSENIMVTDLVRNDLSRVSKAGTVEVTELCGLHSFAKVHHLITTVESELKEGVSTPEILNSCFPPGSMTGAPKKRVCELIMQYEDGPRGLFSGAIGYILPNGDFDFNVVIRSIFYDAAKQTVRVYAGGGITTYSDADEEFAECELKAKALLDVLA